MSKLDPNAYPGWNDSALPQALNDTSGFVDQIARIRGFVPAVYLDEAATSANLHDSLSGAAKRLDASDTLLVTYAGHGGYIRSPSGSWELTDDDKTWALYDREFVHTEFRALWRAFKPGVRVILVVDSCFSGTSIFTEIISRSKKTNGKVSLVKSGRYVPYDFLVKAYEANESEYVKIQELNQDASPPVCGVVGLLACTQTQEAQDTADNGLFTYCLLQVWKRGAYVGDYSRLIDEVKFRIGAWGNSQTPSLDTHGPDDLVNSILAERPFD